MKKLFKCEKCGVVSDKVEIHWGMDCGKKVDIIDYFCTNCGSGKIYFIGTTEEKNEFWDTEWDK